MNNIVIMYKSEVDFSYAYVKTREEAFEALDYIPTATSIFNRHTGEVYWTRGEV